MLTVRIDRYVLDTLMPDLVLHDHQPSGLRRVQAVETVHAAHLAPSI